MSPEAQRIAIAEACGWTQVRQDKDELVGCPPREPSNTNLIIVPDYLNDLNAMHEAEKTLRQGLLGAYCFNLGSILRLSEEIAGWLDGFYLAHATATQRAEAFLRTIGKWRDE